MNDADFLELVLSFKPKYIFILGTVLINSLRKKNVSHGQNKRLCITILLLKFRAIQSLILSSFLFININ